MLKFFKKNKSKAFSLVELSITLLVISILVGGVLGGRALLPIYRLKTAQALTQSAPVSNIEGISLWLETTMPESFATQNMPDGQVITLWNDRNPQANVKNRAVAQVGANITYKLESDIYTLPSLKFDGGNSSYFVLSKDENIANSLPLRTPQNAFTIFLVTKLEKEPVGERAVIFSNGSAASNSGYSYSLSQSMARSINFFGVSEIFSRKNNGKTAAEVTSITYQGGSDGEVKLYTNGVGDGGYGASGTSEYLSIDKVSALSPLLGFYVGGVPNLNHSWNGLISEIIVFNRALEDSERRLMLKNMMVPALLTLRALRSDLLKLPLQDPSLVNRRNIAVKSAILVIMDYCQLALINVAAEMDIY